ncbi:hypothetical protein QZH41_018233, partial [Actinostola sp. cb2023]
MGNNVTVTVNNSTNSTNVSMNGGGGGGGRGPFILPHRSKQTMAAINAQIGFLLYLIVIGLTINTLVTTLLLKKFKTLPYIMLQNIVVVDLLTPILNGPLFFIGLLLDQHGIALPNLCNVQGFFHAALSTVFLNTVTMIAVSRCLAILKPELYHKIFVNKIVIRLLSVGLWSASALICVPPLNYKGWGGYRKLVGTCWLAWIPDNKDFMAYNFLVTFFSLGAAVASSLFAWRALCSIKKVVRVAPQVCAAQDPPPYPGTDDPQPTEKATHTVRLNTEIFLIAATQLILYLLLWIPLTVMDWAFLKDWRMVNYRVIITFVFLFLCRSLFNPIIYFAFSPDMRKEFVNLCLRCKCKGTQNDESNVE